MMRGMALIIAKLKTLISPIILKKGETDYFCPTCATLGAMQS
jgi:hypothetical protein